MREAVCGERRDVDERVASEHEVTDDLADGRPLHQVPVLLWTAGGLDMTHNPAWIEPSALGLRAYFMPEDDHSTLYIYDVESR